MYGIHIEYLIIYIRRNNHGYEKEKRNEEKGHGSWRHEEKMNGTWRHEEKRLC